MNKKTKTVPAKVLGVTVRADEQTVRSYNEAVENLRASLVRFCSVILTELKLRKP